MVLTFPITTVPSRIDSIARFSDDIVLSAAAPELLHGSKLQLT